MKKFIAVLLQITMIVTLFVPLTAYAEGDRVEIDFCVGDDVLMINGESVQVEKPYVVGEGVTLVPVRVITEAFGATVDWIESTQTVNINYPEVSIVLQIDNPVAEVNRQAETLLSAPELTEAGYTMVPLRFISETFGAVVSYNEETERITVIKDKSGNGQSIVTGAITEAKIGDSYYKWTMENPADMQMEERTFDGVFTAFVYDDDNNFTITVDAVPKDYDFAKDFSALKASVTNLTIAKSEKNDNGTVKSMHLQARDKESFLNVQRYITADYVYNLVGVFSNETPEKRDEFVRIMSTFMCGWQSNDTYDLSNVKDGYRTFEAEEINLSMSIPQDYFIVEEEGAINEFDFYKLSDDDHTSSISLSVYSKSAVTGAEALANKDYNGNKETINEKIADYGEGVSTRLYNGFQAFEYNYTIKRSAFEEIARDVFFELGEYVYNVHVRIKLPHTNPAQYIDAIINSIKCEEIDAVAAGTFIRNDPDEEGTYKSSGTNWSLTIPNYYEEAVQDSGAAYLSNVSGTLITFACTSASGGDFDDMREVMNELEKENSLMGKGGTEIQAKDTILNGIKYIDSTIWTEKDGEKTYTRYMGTVKNNKVYLFTIIFSELGYSKKVIQETEDIVASLEL